MTRQFAQSCVRTLALAVTLIHIRRSPAIRGMSHLLGLAFFLPLASLAQPAWQLITHPQTSTGSFATAMATDPQGNFYVTGANPFGVLTIGQTGLDPADGKSFLVSLTPGGTVRWFKQVDAFLLHDVQVDGNGDVYVAGEYTTPVTLDGQQFVPVGVSEALIAKFDNNGTLQWARSSQGSVDAVASVHALAVGPTGRVYITGNYRDQVIFGQQSLDTGNSATHDLFVAGLEPNGTFFFAEAPGQSAMFSAGWGIAVDSAGDAYVAGEYFGATCCLSFPGVSQLFDQSSAPDDRTGFLAKFSPGQGFQWVRKLGADGAGLQDRAWEVVVDDSNHVYVTGTYFDQVLIGNTTLTASTADARASYLAKFDAAGNLRWAVSQDLCGPALGWSPQPLELVSDDAADAIYLARTGSGATFGVGLYATVTEGPLEVHKYDLQGNLQWLKSTTVHHPDWHHGFESTGSGLALSPDGDPVVVSTYRGGVLLDADSVSTTPLAIDTICYPGDTVYNLHANWYVARLGIPNAAQAPVRRLSDFRAGPNPTTGLVRVEAPQGATLKLCDLQGRSLPVTTTAIGNIKELDLWPYPPGIYLLQCFHKGRSRSLKILLQSP